ncbi:MULTISPECIES: YCF48-related protein [unclassified Aureispira]|uniref:WD40/YVTN/BNR-like repeat-containing protein n=1 Tax=unclassified Aureispira TaxID=2649989 RepID=UPI000695F1B3|nr:MULTISPECIES: YCF48-related protein [unclassified Aureispira]WMX14985.1 YCF48-related protein [Aureispira sp. CCB-E]
MKKELKYGVVWLVLWGTILGIGGCDVEDVTYTSKMHQLPTDLDLSDVYFLNQDTGYVSAGNLFTAGLVLGTYNGGITWDTIVAYERGVNSLSYQNGIFTASLCGQRMYSSPDFSNWTFNNANLGWWNWQKHIRLMDNRVLLVGGENFGSGYIHIYDPTQGNITIKDTFNHEIADIAVTGNRTIHAVGYGLILKSTDEGNSWILSSITGDFFKGVDFVGDNIGYVVGEYGTVYKTTNGGNSWKTCRGGNSVFADQSKLLRDVAFLNESTGFLVGTNNLVYRTTDGGKLWKRISNLDGYADFNAIRIQHGNAYLTGHEGNLLIIDLE